MPDRLKHTKLNIVFDAEEYESIFFIVHTRNNKYIYIVFGSVYRPLNTDIDKFIAEYSKVIHEIKKIQNNIVLGLDHNMDFLKLSRHTCTHVNIMP